MLAIKDIIRRLEGLGRHSGAALPQAAAFGGGRIFVISFGTISNLVLLRV